MLCRLAVMIFAVMSVSTVALNAAEPILDDVAFTSTLDGSEQRYIQILPVDFQKDQSHDLLIALHGHGSDRWQFAQQTRDECRSSREFAAKYQMIFISPDYRAKTSWMGPKAEADMVQIIQELKKTQRIGKVLICGGSMGGTSALTFTALHPELVDGVAAMNGTANFLEYTQFQDAISESFGGAKATIPDEYKKRSAEYWPERFTMPVAIATGGQDELVPPHSCLRLAGVLTQLNRPVLLIHREQGGHNTNYADAMAILEFVREKAADPKEQLTK